jgi:hypothetical protein
MRHNRQQIALRAASLIPQMTLPLVSSTLSRYLSVWAPA